MFLSKYRKHILLGLLLIISSLMTSGQIASAKSEDKISVAKVKNYYNDVEESEKNTITNSLRSYSANVSPVSDFFDSEGNFNTVYDSDKTITLVKYDKDYSKIKTYSIEKPYPLYGGAISDEKGNYYIVYGQNNETDNGDRPVIIIVKYNPNLGYISEVKYSGSETCPYPGIKWGTKTPFQAGNCDIAITNDILVFTYARQMYSLHQSNHVIFINKNTMTKVNHAGSYTSHSFDQRVLVTENGDYLFADHGDAFDRGFKISSVQKGSNNIWDTIGYVSFHFREGANRDYGYNETYAQLGGIAEIDTGYVLAGASEKTLSIIPAPTSRNYCGYSEARNIFIQILDKNFMYYTGEDKQVLKTDIRKATGTKPATAKTKLYLEGNEKNYGVLWLTDYSDEYCAVNPKLVTTEDNRIVLMWEKFKYESENGYERFVDSYYMVLSNNGELLQEETSLRGIRLTENETPVYRDNKVYFSTLDGKNKRLTLNVLHLGEIIDLIDINALTYNNIKNQDCTYDYIEPELIIKHNNIALTKGMDYILEYRDNVYPGKAKITVKGIGPYFGEKDIHFYIKPEKVEIFTLDSNKKGSFTFYAGNYSWDDNQGVQIVYSKDRKFTNKKTVNKDEGTVSKLTSKTTYYVKARSYITIDGKKIYSSYSKTHTIKVK